jgi:hypothetical protein
MTDAMRDVMEFAREKNGWGAGKRPPSLPPAYTAGGVEKGNGSASQSSLASESIDTASLSPVTASESLERALHSPVRADASRRGSNSENIIGNTMDNTIGNSYSNGTLITPTSVTSSSPVSTTVVKSWQQTTIDSASSDVSFLGGLMLGTPPAEQSILNTLM